MKFQITTPLPVLAACLLMAGCGGDGDAANEMAAPAPVAPPVAVNSATIAPTAPPQTAAPPAGTAPATMAPAAEAPDLFANYKVSVDGSPNKSDVETMQAIVDAYAFGPDGLGAPLLNSLDDLVTKGYLKRLPPAPKGMKWAYDSPKWKVSVVPQ